MLVLTRKLEEQIRIGDDITISILRVKGNTVRVGIEAPRAIRVVRGELPRQDQPKTPPLNQASRGAELPESSAAGEGPSPDGAKLPAPATTAVRQFLARRARRQNRASTLHRLVDKAVATTAARSA